MFVLVLEADRLGCHKDGDAFSAKVPIQDVVASIVKQLGKALVSFDFRVGFLVDGVQRENMWEESVVDIPPIVYEDTDR